MALARMEEIMLCHGRVFTGEAAQELRDMYVMWRSGHDRLGQEALAKSLCRWPVRPKHHFCEHVFLDSGLLNPRFTHNYVNEDMVRRVKQLAARSHPAYLAKHVSMKYALQVCLKWR